VATNDERRESSSTRTQAHSHRSPVHSQARLQTSSALELCDSNYAPVVVVGGFAGFECLTSQHLQLRPNYSTSIMYSYH
jgi:hypothetical protein